MAAHVETVQGGRHSTTNACWSAFQCSLECRLTVPVKKLLNHRTQVVNLMKVLSFPCVGTLRGSSLWRSSGRSAGGRLGKLDDSKAALGLFVKKMSALHHPPFHSRGKWPSAMMSLGLCVIFNACHFLTRWSVHRDVVGNSPRHSGNCRVGVG